MINSMTGFGRFEAAEGRRKFIVELKSVNHRYLDLNIKMPKQLNALEAAIRSLLKEYIERGKVDVYITCEKDTEDDALRVLDDIRSIHSSDYGWVEIKGFVEQLPNGKWRAVRHHVQYK